MAQTQRVSGVATKVWVKDDTKYIKYHQTVVVKFDSFGFMLNSGGWKTATTKLRMNQAANQFNLGYSVYQKNGDWFVRYYGKDIEYFDGIYLPILD